MNYQRLHDLIIADARTNPPTGYTESHHIVPRCMGGGNEKANRVRLTARQHFVIHRLLTKIYPEHQGLRYAFSMMFKDKGTRITDAGWIKSSSRRHEFHRSKMSEIMRARNLSRPVNPMLGKKHSPETRKKLSKIHRERIRGPISAAHKELIAINRSKSYLVTTPENITEKVTNLAQYCRDKNLSAACMGCVARGVCKQHKGYRVIFSPADPA